MDSSRQELQKLTVDQLKQLCREQQLAVQGRKKNQLIDLLLTQDQDTLEVEEEGAADEDNQSEVGSHVSRRSSRSSSSKPGLEVS